MEKNVLRFALLERKIDDFIRVSRKTKAREQRLTEA